MLPRLRLLLSLFLLAGCAMHAPMSETILFHDPGRTTPSHTDSFTFGFTSTHALCSTRFIRKNLNRHRPEDAKFRHLQNACGVAGGIYISSYREGVGFSTTIGFGELGADVSGKLWQRNYLTASASAYGGWQVILHHRTLNSPHFGATFGLALRQDRQYYFSTSEVISFDAGVPVLINSIGIRAVGIFRSDPTISGDWYAGVYLGYAPRYQRPIVSLSVSFGGF